VLGKVRTEINFAPKER
jgi:hypothetical protein